MFRCIDTSVYVDGQSFDCLCIFRMLVLVPLKYIDDKRHRPEFWASASPLSPLFPSYLSPSFLLAAAASTLSSSFTYKPYPPASLFFILADTEAERFVKTENIFPIRNTLMHLDPFSHFYHLPKTFSSPREIRTKNRKHAAAPRFLMVTNRTRIKGQIIG